MTTALTVSTSLRPDGTPVLTAVGEVDMSNADTFARAIGEAAGGAGGKPLLIDLTGVTYLDSAGLTALFTNASRIQLIANPLLHPVLTISGITTLTTVHGLDPEPTARD